MEAEIEELLVLDAESGVALTLLVVQIGDGSNHKEVEEEGQLT